MNIIFYHVYVLLSHQNFNMYIRLALLYFLGCLLEVPVEAKHTCSAYSTYNESLKVCVCPDEIKRFLHCNKYGYIDAVKDCACVTYNEDTDEVEVGYCIYGCSRDLNTSYSNRPNGFSFIGTEKNGWNNLSCGPFQRTGTLCGSCMNGSYPPAYSFDVKCIQCINGNKDIWKYLLLAILPLTVLFFTLLLLQINILSSSLFGFVLYSQIVSLPSFVRALVVNKSDQIAATKFIRTFEMLYGIWNLDFFRTFNHGFCLEHNPLTVLSLDFAVAVYPLFLMGVTYLLILLYDIKSKPFISVFRPFFKYIFFFKRSRKIRTSIVNSFATIILLSNIKLLSACLDILVPVDVYKFHSKKNFAVKHYRKLYSDATLEYLGPEHLPYAVMAILVFGVFVFLPVLTLCLYPFQFFQKVMNKFPSRCILFMNTFVDSFQGCYKDGTDQNCRDYRWFSVTPFIIRWVCFVAYAFTLNASYFTQIAIIMTLLTVTLIVFDPLQHTYHSMYYYWIIHTLLLSVFGVSAAGTDIVQITGQSTSQLYIFYFFYAAVTVFPIIGLIVLIFRLSLFYKHTSKIIKY